MAPGTPVMPAARPVPVEAVQDRGPTTPAARRRLAWTLGAFVLPAVLWWATGIDLAYGAVVAATTIAVVGEPRSVGRAVRSVALVAVVTSAGAIALGTLGIGLPVPERLIQGAIGLVVGALVTAVHLHRRTHPGARG